jgi:hypothetical protein
MALLMPVTEKPLRWKKSWLASKVLILLKAVLVASEMAL